MLSHDSADDTLVSARQSMPDWRGTSTGPTCVPSPTRTSRGGPEPGRMRGPATGIVGRWRDGGGCSRTARGHRWRVHGNGQVGMGSAHPRVHDAAGRRRAADRPRPDDVGASGIAIDAAGRRGGRRRGRNGVGRRDLVVAENICSAPTDPARCPTRRPTLTPSSGSSSSSTTTTCPGSGRARSHPWSFPPDFPGALHIVVNDRRATSRGAWHHSPQRSTNTFDSSTAPPAIVTPRASSGFAADELVVLQPTRAIRRKNVPAVRDSPTALAGFVARPARRATGSPDRPRTATTAVAQATATTTLRVPVTVGLGLHRRTPTRPPTSWCSPRRWRASATP